MRALTKLLKRLDVTPTGSDEFLGGAGLGGAPNGERLYGGLVAAQATVAAARTVSDLQLHSLHALFLRPGRAEKDIRFSVTRSKSGRNFHARLVTATQGDQVIFQMQASFGRFESGVEHQDEMPRAPAPETCIDRDVLRGRDPDAMPIEVRMIDPIEEAAPQAPTTAIWVRPRGQLPDDPVLHAATVVYSTDRVFLGTAWRPHAGKGDFAGASLDHTLWFHAPVRFDDWLLFSMHSPIARYERGLVQGALYQPHGLRIASVAQEGNLRLLHGTS